MSTTMERSLDAVDVAAWLREHPDFLTQFPDVALHIKMPRELGAATSLASYQLDVLREKNRELERRLQELFAVANENERLTVRTHQFVLALMRASSIAEVLNTVVASLQEDFNSEQVRLLLQLPQGVVPESPWWKGVSPGATEMACFADVLAGKTPVCGRLTTEKLETLFGKEAGIVHSTALLPLAGYGLLAVGSADPNRFYPGMGTLFLRLMSDAVLAALQRFHPAV